MSDVSVSATVSISFLKNSSLFNLITSFLPSIIKTKYTFGSSTDAINNLLLILSISISRESKIVLSGMKDTFVENGASPVKGFISLCLSLQFSNSNIACLSLYISIEYETLKAFTATIPIPFFPTDILYAVLLLLNLAPLNNFVDIVIGTSFS